MTRFWVGTGGYATIEACLAAVAARHGGACWIGPNSANGTFAETLSAAIAWPPVHNVGLIATVPVAVTCADASPGCLSVPAGTQGGYIKGLPSGTNNFPGAGSSSFSFNYAAAGGAKAFQIGGSSAPTNYFDISDVSLYIFSAAPNAIGIDFVRVLNSTFINLATLGKGGTQKCWSLDGAGGYTGQNTFVNSTVTGCQTLVQFNTANNNQFIGSSQFFTPAAGGIGFDIEAGDGNGGTVDIESTSTALNFASSLHVFGNRFFAYLGDNMTDVRFGANSFQNEVYVQGGLGSGSDPAVSDSSPPGNHNSVWNPRKYRMDASGDFTVAGALSAAAFQLAHLVDSSKAPTIAAGFGTSPSIVTNNGTAAFTLNVGAGGTATDGVIGLPPAANGWNCTCQDTTTFSTAVFLCRQTSSTTTSAAIGNFNASAGRAAWAAGDVLNVECRAR